MAAEDDSVGRAVRAWFQAVEGPGLGRVGGAADPAVTADGRLLAVTAFTRVSLDEPVRSAIAVVDPAAGTLESLTHGDHDRLPRWSPDGRSLAWLTDAGRPGRRWPAWCAVDGSGVAVGTIRTAQLTGEAEDLRWSPDGSRLLVVERTGDVPGPTSTGRPPGSASDDWRPTVLRPAEPGGWRSLVVVDAVSGDFEPLGPAGVNVWEATWCGPAAVAAVVSDGPGEETWYSARLLLVPTQQAGNSLDLRRPAVQLGRPQASASGRRLAVIEAFCSDRSLVAGALVVVETAEAGRPSAEPRTLDTADVDVTATAWLGEDVLAFIGVRGLQTVAGEVDVVAGTVRETWVSDGSTSGAYPEAAWSVGGTIHVVAESYTQPPKLSVISGGWARTVVGFGHDGTAELLRRAGRIEAVSWQAPDGLRIDGLLVRPDTAGPHPLVLDVHGGPVWAWRNQFRMGQYTTPLLVSLGYAVLFANPRGSAGRGRGFAQLVERDVCGPDTTDLLSGLDHLIATGVADPTRIAVTGTSYGGTMACWLPSQDTRFAAAVAVAGGTDWVSFHFTTDIPDLDELVLPGSALDPDGEYVRRSPLTHAAAVRTPVLHLAGALDTCVPLGQALEFHRALSLRGAPSELVVYPAEGHGVHDFPAVADAVHRTVEWIVRYLPSAIEPTVTPSPDGIV